MTLDVTLERPTGTGEKKLVDRENVSKLLNVPMSAKVRLEYEDRESETVPCASVVNVQEHD